MNNLLEVKKLKEGCPIMVAKIPQLIIKELDVWVKESRKSKDHPLAELKAHENIGYLAGDGKAHNSYQTSIPPRLIEESYWLAWVVRLSAKHYGMGRSHRFFKVRSWSGHFDGYDVWTNFAYKGDDNPLHSHAGFLSGVIYYKNHGHPTIFDDFNCQYGGKDGTMVIFPSDTRHHVEEQTSNKERITIAFNVMQLPQNEPNELNK